MYDLVGGPGFFLKVRARPPGPAHPVRPAWTRIPYKSSIDIDLFCIAFPDLQPLPQYHEIASTKYKSSTNFKTCLPPRFYFSKVWMFWCLANFCNIF